MRSHCTALPTRRQLQYVLEDAEVAAVLASKRHADRLHALAKAWTSPLQLLLLLVPAVGHLQLLTYSPDALFSV